MDGGASHSGGPADVPITPEMLADLQAGLLDDATAARLRWRARTDPDSARQLAALHRVRRELAELGADEASAADVPAAVTARLGAALQAVPRKRAVPPPPSGHRVVGASGRKAAHAARGSRPRSRRLRRLGALAGLFAAVVAVGLGAVMLVRPPSPAPSSGPTAEHLTVSPPPHGIPLSDPQIVGLLTRNAERPASTAWATRQPPRCSVPSPSTSTAAPVCCWCCPATRPRRWSPWWSHPTAALPAPNY